MIVLLVQIMATLAMFCVSAQNDGGSLGWDEPDKVTSAVVSSPVSSRGPILSTLTQKVAAADAKKSLQTYSIARPPLISASLGIGPLHSRPTEPASLPSPEPEPEAISSLSFNPTTPTAQEHKLTLVDQLSTSAKFAAEFISDLAQSTPLATETPLKPIITTSETDLRLTSIPDPEPESNPVNASSTAQVHQSSAFEDDAEQLSEEDYGSHVESVSQFAVFI